MALPGNGENTPPATTRSSDSKFSGTKDRAKARWSILRNALLQKAHQSSAANSRQHSIHRFPGYQLLERRPANCTGSEITSQLKLLRWDAKQSTHENQSRLSVACLGVAAVYPKGQCVDILDCPPHKTWFESLNEMCNHVVSLLVVEDKNPNVVTLLVQEKSSTTTYTVYEYALDSRCSIWTREPQEGSRRLSLNDLVSHRKTGVDNTGNVCVWDSERTLAHLLYHHYNDFRALRQASPRRILELGTGMAGIAAIALGLRLVQQEHNGCQSEVQVMLTDGHPDGVLNNRINQMLTKLSTCKDNKHPYHALDVSEQLLLWTADLEPSVSSSQLYSYYDVVLVSDCTHFQEFHAALAITTLRSLRVGGVAIFCQPTRGDSLDNFYDVLLTTTKDVTTGLVNLEWWTHTVLSDQEAQAREKYPGVYDVDLHCPKILVVKKLRELTREDCERIVHQQKTRR